MSAEQSAVDPHLGRIVAGKYRLQSLIGQGSMGSVYAAEQIALRKPVAIKVMHAELAANRSFAERFNHEAQATSRMSHPNSILVTDFGEDTDGLLYLVMERVVGKSLDSLIVDQPLMPERRVADLMAQALSALAVAHDAGIVHRDLKPENMLVVEGVDDDGNVIDLLKVCDFGIASMLTHQTVPRSVPPGAEGVAVPTRRGARLTAVGSLIGTPAYMSPEQAQGMDSDSRSDLYAIGVVLYELMTGSIPFTADRVEEIALKQITDIPVPPSQIRPEVSPELEVICLKALEKSPARRYESAREMRAALRDFVRSRSGPEPQLAPQSSMSIASDEVARPYADTLAASGRPPLEATASVASAATQNGSAPRPKSIRSTVIAFAGLAFAAAGVGGLLWSRTRGVNAGLTPTASTSMGLIADALTTVQSDTMQPLQPLQPLASGFRRADAPLATSSARDAVKALPTAGARDPKEIARLASANVGQRPLAAELPVSSATQAAFAGGTPVLAAVSAAPAPTASVAPPVAMVTAAPSEVAAPVSAVVPENGRVVASVSAVSVIPRGNVISLLNRINFSGCYQAQLRALGRAEVGTGTIKVEFDEEGRAQVKAISLPPALRPASGCMTAKIQNQTAKAPDTGTSTAEITLMFEMK